jgi:hypothetical protein
MKRSPIGLVALLAASGAGVATLAPATVVAQPRPILERIEPTAGPPGTRVRIHGRGFTRGYRVLYGEAPLTPAEFLPERITVTVPDGAATGRFVLSNGTDEVESEVFRVTAPMPAPTVARVEPASAAPGMEVTLRGDNFAARPMDNTVLLGGRPMVVRSGDSTALRVIVPDGATTGPVTVRTGGGEAQSPAPLVVNPRVIVREIVPAAIAPGGRVTLRGDGFVTTPAQNRVSLGGRPLRVVRATATALEVDVPLDAVTGTVLVEVPNAGRYETPTRLFVGPAPVVRTFEPPRAAPGARVVLRGEHFGSEAGRVQVTFGERPATVVSVAPNELVVTVPQGAVTGRVHVTAAGVGPVASSVDFSVLQPVSLTRFEPRAADVGDTVTLTGTGFDPDPSRNTVTLGAARLRVLRATETELAVEVVAGARSGALNVTVEGNGSARAREPFMVSQRPRITALEPDRGVPGAHVVLRGSNFPTDRALVQVRLNGVDVPIEAYSAEALTVRVPANAQTGRFQVIGRLQGNGTAATDFVVLQPVALRAVEPPAGPVGATITLRGEGFEPDPARLTVRLGTTVVRPVRNSTTEIAFVVPRASRGGPITVEAEGRQPVTTAEPFAVTVPPVLTGFSPVAVAPGAQLTLRGRNLGTSTATTGVLVGDVTCPVATVTPTQVVCVVPAEARTGPVVVRVANAGEARGRAPLRVLPAPATPTPPAPAPAAPAAPAATPSPAPTSPAPTSPAPTSPAP